MSIFQEFLENSLNKKIKNLVPLTGGASADINRIIFEDNKEFIVRRSVVKDKAVMAISKNMEAKIQKIVKEYGAPVPEIIMEFSEGAEIGEGYVMHSFRHSMRDRLRAVSCPSEMIDQIGGWSKALVGEGYGEGYKISPLRGWMLELDRTVCRI